MIKIFEYNTGEPTIVIRPTYHIYVRKQLDSMYGLVFEIEIPSINQIVRLKHSSLLKVLEAIRLLEEDDSLKNISLNNCIKVDINRKIVKSR